MPLSPADLRRLADELESDAGAELEIITVRDEGLEAALVEHERQRFQRRARALRPVHWLDAIGLAMVGSGGIIESMLTQPGTTVHEWAIGIGAPTIMGAGGIVLKRLKALFS